MQGKTTFILKDKDTGKIVDEREEHNMVTNALRDIFDFPKIMLFTLNSNSMMGNYLPIYKNLLHGLMLFGENIPERKDDYFMNERYNIVGTAGSAYTGTDPKRGTFNESASGSIENGYRLVWDFAPEKAIGTINCAGLSCIHSGNRGSTFSAGDVFTSAMDFGNSSNGKVFALTGSFQGTYIMNRGDYHYYYQYTTAGKALTLRKYIAPDPEKIHITTQSVAALVETKALNLPINMNEFSVDEDNGKLYIMELTLNSSKRVCVKVAVLDVTTYEIELITEEPVETLASTSNTSICNAAINNGKICIEINSQLYIHNLDGTLEKQYSLLTSSVSSMFIKDGVVWLCGRYSSSASPCYVAIEDEPVYLPNISGYNDFRFHKNKNIRDPFVAAGNSQSLYIMMRTDYLATINNLSEPLVKTDQHALQVRYELTE